MFNLEGAGIVRFHSPITFRWVLFNPKTRPEDPSHVGSDGRAEVEFQKYVAMDRHGGELTGALYDGEGGSGGAPTGNHPCSSHPIDDPFYGCMALRHWWSWLRFDISSRVMPIGGGNTALHVKLLQP